MVREYFSDKDILNILSTNKKENILSLNEKARVVTRSIYSNKIFIRGLIEISNYCKNNCYYCGINNTMKIKRFRLSSEEIINSAKLAYEEGFRTFVLQGGEDSFFNDDILSKIIYTIKNMFPDTRITLSLGVRSKKSYKILKNMGADRYLLRFEAEGNVFKSLHESSQSLEKRKNALLDLRDVGFVIGTGFLVDPPFSTHKNILNSIKFIRSLEPEMIGIGPFIPASNTIFEKYPSGSVENTLKIISILRIENPHSLIPSTTALNTIDKDGRIKGILAGANVVMPNISPEIAKDNYKLYDNKNSTGLESLYGLKALEELLNEYGYEIDYSKGDNK